MREVHRRAPNTYRYQRYRTRIGGRPETLINLEDWIPEHTPTDRDSLAVYALSTAHDNNSAGAWCWAVPPWLGDPDGTDAPRLRAALGATTSGAPTLPSHPYSGPPLPRTATITLPWRQRPLVADPTDAADLAHWYHRSGWAQGWSPLACHGADGPSEARRPSIAVPFWVPDEFCGAFATAQPLPAGTPLRLPFPRVFACFSDPWTLPPQPDSPDDGGNANRADAAVAAPRTWPYPAMLHARGRAHRHEAPTLEGVLHRLQAWTIERSRLPTPLQVATQLGARVEGLIFTAEPDGTPHDAFAWCLKLPHPWGTTLARILVPASRQASAWRAPVDNLLAAIALSSWHPIDSAHPQPGDTSPRPTTPIMDDPAAQVRVLDIDTTAAPRRGGRSDGVASRRSHLRRGHWRQQRVGTGRRDTRWTWVRPTTVNPGGSHSTQVYRLPVITE